MVVDETRLRMPPPSMLGTVMTDEPPLRWRSAKLGRKHFSQDEADWASEPAAAWEPPVDLGKKWICWRK
jgi:hypothetical protein